jgi:hypothetical protein
MKGSPLEGIIRRVDIRKFDVLLDHNSLRYNSMQSHPALISHKHPLINTSPKYLLQNISPFKQILANLQIQQLAGSHSFVCLVDAPFSAIATSEMLVLDSIVKRRVPYHHLQNSWLRHWQTFNNLQLASQSASYVVNNVSLLFTSIPAQAKLAPKINTVLEQESQCSPLRS